MYNQVVSTIKNSFIVIIFMALGMCIAAQAEAATLSVSPSTGVYTAGQTFTVRILVNTQGAPINASEATLSFNPAQLSVVRVSKGSIFNLWTVEPTFSNTAGTITLGGGSPSGYTGAAGTIVTVTFRSKGSGAAKVSFKNGSVLAADGLGTNVLRSMNGGSYTIASAAVVPEPEVIEYIAPANTPAAPKITSRTHADPAGWSDASTAELSWTVPADVTGVRTLLDGNSGSIPTKVYDSPISSITLNDLEDGVQYFHIQFRNADGWGRVSHYRLAIDTKKPESFSIALAENADLSNPEQKLLFTIEESVSSVERYLVQVDGGEPYEYIDETGSSTITLPSLDPGYHTVVIEAFDLAGNSIISTFSLNILAFDKPQFTEYPSRLGEEVVPVISGITRPGSSVTATITKLGVTDSEAGAVQTYTTVANDEGVFTIIPDGRLSSGVYELTAVATDIYGAQSDRSDVVRMAVEKPGYIQIGSLIVSVLSVLVPLLALVLLLVLGVVFFVARLRTIRRYVVAETDEALSVLDDVFTDLTATIAEQKTLLVKSRKTKKLTKAEDVLLTEVLSHIDTAKTKLTKEISDVDDIVKK